MLGAVWSRSHRVNPSAGGPPYTLNYKSRVSVGIRPSRGRPAAFSRSAGAPQRRLSRKVRPRGRRRAPGVCSYVTS